MGKDGSIMNILMKVKWVLTTFPVNTSLCPEPKLLKVGDKDSFVHYVQNPWFFSGTVVLEAKRVDVSDYHRKINDTIIEHKVKHNLNLIFKSKAQLPWKTPIITGYEYEVHLH